MAAVDMTGSADIDPDTIPAVAGLSNVDWVFGLGSVVDTYNSAKGIDGTGVATRTFYGDLTEVVVLTKGRFPQAGEAIISEQAASQLGLVDGIGSVEDLTGNSYAVVGAFKADQALKALANAVLVVPEADSSEYISYIYLGAEEARFVDQIVTDLPLLIHASAIENVSVEAPSGLVQVRESIASGLAKNSRFMMLATLAVGLIIISVTTLAAAAARKKDFGRKRALGATRSLLIAHILIQTFLAALIGAVLGVLGGVAVTLGSGGNLVSGGFLFGLAVLAAVCATLAAVAPAVWASRQDPVRILRVP